MKIESDEFAATIASSECIGKSRRFCHKIKRIKNVLNDSVQMCSLASVAPEKAEKKRKLLTLVHSFCLALIRFERRLWRRTERRIAKLRSWPDSLRLWAGVVVASAFGLVLGAVIVISAAHLRHGETPPVVAVPVDGLVVVRSDVKKAADSADVPEDPAVRAAMEEASEWTAAQTDAEFNADLAALNPDSQALPPEVQTPPLAMEALSVEQGPAASGAVAAPKRVQVAGLPIPPNPQWLRNALRTPDTGGAPMIAVIIDDAGVNQRRTYEAVRLPGPLTIAFIPYGSHLKEHVAAARRSGHEIMVHIPMEPLDPGADPGPHALLTSLGSDEILRRLRWGLDRIDGYVGISNHMGSRFTTWDEGMRVVMGEVRRRGLLFVDSWTHSRSLGMPLSRSFRVPNAARDIFIDHDITETAIRRRLGLLEKIASRRGYSVGIAHPYPLSMHILQEWTASVQVRGYRLVPVSAIVKHRMGRR